MGKDTEWALVKDKGAGLEALGVDDEGNTTHSIFQVGKIDRTLIALDGPTVRVLDCAELQRPVGTFGEPAMKVKGAIAIGSGTTVIVRYVDSNNKPTNYLECWNYKTQQSMWEIKVDGDVTHMTPVFDKNRKTRRYADAVVVASRVGMTNAGLAVIGANGKFRSDPCTMAGRISQLVSDIDAGGNAALAITDEGTVAWIASDGKMQGEPLTIDGLISTLAMNADGSEAVAGTVDGEVWWIDSAYGEDVDQKPIRLKGGISHLMITPDGTECLAGTMHGVVAWMTPDGIRGESELRGLSTYVTALVMSEDGQQAVAGTNIGSLEWIGADGVVEGSVAELAGSITHLKMNRDGNLALAGTKDGVVAWVNISGEIVGQSNLGDEISCLELTVDHTMALAGMASGEIIIIGADGQPAVTERPNLFGRVSQLTMKANGTGALAVTDEGTAAWVTMEGKLDGGTAETDELMTALIMNPEADTVLAAATKYDDDGYRSRVMWLKKNDSGISLDGAKAIAAAELRGESCRMRGEYTNVLGQVTSLAISDDGKIGVASTQEGNLTWINENGGEPGKTMSMESEITLMDLNENSSKVLVATKTGAIAWVTNEAEVQGEIVQLETGVTALDGTCQGGGILGTKAGEIVRFDESGGDLQWRKQLDHGAITTVDALQDGKILVGTADGTVAWVSPEGAMIRDIRVPVRQGKGGVFQVKLSIDGTSAVVSTMGGVVARVPFDADKDMTFLTGFTGTPATLLPYGEQDEYLAFDIGASTCTFIGVATGGLVGEAGEKMEAEMQKLGAAGQMAGAMAAQGISEIGIHLSTVPNGAYYQFNSQQYLMGQWNKQHPVALIGDQMIFGRSLSRMWGVDVSLMMVHGVEVVNSIGPGRAEMSSIAQFIEFYASRANYAQTSALLFITQWQFISMAFHPSIGWLLPEWAMFVIRFPATFGLDSEWIPLPPAEVGGPCGDFVPPDRCCGNETLPEVAFYVPAPICYLDLLEDGSMSDDDKLQQMLEEDDTSWLFALSAILLTIGFMVVLAFQEIVEDNVFHRVPGPWPQIWQILQGFCAAMSGPFFMPIVGVLLDPLSNSDGSVINQFKMYPIPAVLCLLFAYIHIMLSLRMARVAKDLSAIEFKWYRPGQSSKDIGSRKPSTNPLEELEERWLPTFQKSIADKDTNLRLLNIAVPSVFPHNPKMIALTIFITGLWLTVDAIFTTDRSTGFRWSGPYPDRKTNQGVFLLKLLTFITGLWALMIGFMGMDGDTSDTKVFQATFGVVAITLLALPAVFLTPLMTLFLQRSQPPKVDARDIVDDITNPTFEVESTSVDEDAASAGAAGGHVDAADNGGVEWKDDY